MCPVQPNSNLQTKYQIFRSNGSWDIVLTKICFDTEVQANRKTDPQWNYTVRHESVKFQVFEFVRRKMGKSGGSIFNKLIFFIPNESFIQWKNDKNEFLKYHT